MSESISNEQPPILTDTDLETVDRVLFDIAANRVDGNGRPTSEEIVTGVTNDGTLVSVDRHVGSPLYTIRAGSLAELAQGAGMAVCEASIEEDGFYFRDGGTTILQSDLGGLAIPSEFDEDQRSFLAGKVLFPISELKQPTAESGSGQPVVDDRQVAKRGLFRKLRRK